MGCFHVKLVFSSISIEILSDFLATGQSNLSNLACIVKTFVQYGALLNPELREMHGELIRTTIDWDINRENLT